MVQFESPQPSVMHIVEVEQDSTTGKLTAISSQPIDTSKYAGAWILCAGAVSPWGTHLAGEEYEPDARLIEEATSISGDEEGSLINLDEDLASSVLGFLRYFDSYDDNISADDARKLFNPYNYGFAIEVKALDGGKYESSKWYTLGRNSKELVYVMPDEKTVYITDDGTNVGFWKFVADKPKDLSSGTLYGMKVAQKDGENVFDISWIELGSATQNEIASMIDGLSFSKIFATASPNEDGTCPGGFTSINSGNAGHECLMLKDGMETAAAFLETRRYTAMMGGTTEFSKWEGLSFSPSRNQIFTAMSEIRNGMEDNKSKGKDDDSYDVGGPNSVKLDYNPCGCVYVLDVDDAYSATNMYPLVCGVPMEVDESNGCSLDNIANPDNVAVMDEFDTLIIGEDTGSGHQNDVMWTYNLNNGNMTRIFSTPYGSETTSPYFYNNINGFAYIVGTVQHPYGETDDDKADETINPEFDGKEAYVGYFVMPTAEIQNKSLIFAGIPTATTNAEKASVYGSPTVDVCTKSASQSTYVTPLAVAPETSPSSDSSSPTPSPTPTSPSATPAPAPAPKPPSSIMKVTAGFSALFLFALAL